MVVLRPAMLGAGAHLDPVPPSYWGTLRGTTTDSAARSGPITSSLQPGVHVLHGHSRPLLCRLEQVHRPALACHVHWSARVRPRAPINGTRYYSSHTAFW